MKSKIYSLIVLGVCCIICGCQPSSTPPANGGGKTETPKTSINSGASEGSGNTQLVKVSLAVPHMT